MGDPSAVRPRAASAVAAREEVVGFVAGDGLPLKLKHPVGERAPTKGPVLLVHGAGVRSEIFRPPTGRTLVDVLLEEGHDVWLEDWRASIDIPHNRWDLDEAALYDHPAAVRTVLDRTGADELKAVIHCQGSTSFAMSAAAGLLPEVTTIVANAVSLHPVVPRRSELKLRAAIPLAARLVGYLDPQWARDERTPGLAARAFVLASRLLHRNCGNDVCRMSNFTYGAANDTLWGHDHLDETTHAWLAGEFAQVPLTFFRQILAGVKAGQLVTTGRHAGLPDDLLGELRSEARWVLLAGERNLCFDAESQRRTFAWLERHQPGRHALHVLPGYGHLDVFLGRDAPRDTFPVIAEALS